MFPLREMQFHRTVLSNFELYFWKQTTLRIVDFMVDSRLTDMISHVNCPNVHQVKTHHL